MFMVASSVVSTILILNYHHRNADTHEMSTWVLTLLYCNTERNPCIPTSILDKIVVPGLASEDPAHASTGGHWRRVQLRVK